MSNWKLNVSSVLIIINPCTCVRGKVIDRLHAHHSVIFNPPPPQITRSGILDQAVNKSTCPKSYETVKNCLCFNLLVSGRLRAWAAQIMCFHVGKQTPTDPHLTQLYIYHACGATMIICMPISAASSISIRRTEAQVECTCNVITYRLHAYLLSKWDLRGTKILFQGTLGC